MNAPAASATGRHSPRSLAGAVIGAVIGALAALVLVTVWALVATMVGGLFTTIPVGWAALTGALIGAGESLVRTQRATPWSAAIGLGLGAALVWLIVTGYRPLGLADVRPFWGVVMAFVTFAGVGYLTRYGLRDLDLGGVRRDMLEVIALRVLRGAGFTFFLSIIVFPFYFMVASSLKSRAEMLRDPTNLVINLGQDLGILLSGYREVLVTFNFWRYIGNSGLVAFITMLVTLVLAVLGAYAVTRLRFPGRDVMSRSILLIYMFPAIVLVIPLYAVFTQLGLRNTIPGLLIVYPAMTIPVALYMLRSYFQTLPKDLEEAGMIDGCTRAEVIWRITLPLSMPALASVGLYVFMIAWNEFLFAFMFLDNPQIFTLPRGMVMLDDQEVPRQYLMAGAVIITVPIMVLFFWFERYLVGGLTAGGVKG